MRRPCAESLGGRAAAVGPIYGAWWGRNIAADAKAAFDASVRRYLAAIADQAGPGCDAAVILLPSQTALPSGIVSLYQAFSRHPCPPEPHNDHHHRPQSQPFQAEVAELLHLMVHSVYSETDIFLRELISNASDACDKLRYEAIAAPDLIADGAPPKIRIKPDKKADTLAVIDSGIGMDRQELIDNLGTIARSGTKSFLSSLAEAKDGAGLIGQFGVGFYSAFMVADRIVVTSRRAGPTRCGPGRRRAAADLKSRRPAKRMPSA